LSVVESIIAVVSIGNWRLSSRSRRVFAVYKCKRFSFTYHSAKI